MDFIVITLSVYGCIYAFSKFLKLVADLADKSVKPKYVKKFSNILKNQLLTPTLQHSFTSFNLFSEGLFGKKIFSFRALISSILLSIFWITLISIICIILSPDFRSWFTHQTFNKLILTSFLYLFPIILALDYFSITTTRTIIKKTCLKRRSLTTYLLIVFLDAFVSIIIFSTGLLTIKGIIYNTPLNDIYAPINHILSWLNITQIESLMKPLEDLYKIDNDNYGTKSGNGWSTKIVYALPEGIMFYSSLLTSIWLWIHTFGYFASKLAMKIDFIKNKWLSMCDIKNRTFHSLALLIIIALVLVSPLLIIFFSLLKIYFFKS